MKRKKYHKGNFFKHSYCVFDERSFDEIKDIAHNYVSESGSKYIFLEEGLYRISNHWGRVANCRWKLNSLDKKSQELKLGFALWDNFYPNDETQNIFYIEYDISTQTYQYKHKLQSNQVHIYRNAAQTAKVLKDIKLIHETSSWAKHLQYDDLEVLKNEIITSLIKTNKTLLEIKRDFL